MSSSGGADAQSGRDTVGLLLRRKVDALRKAVQGKKKTSAADRPEFQAQIYDFITFVESNAVMLSTVFQFAFVPGVIVRAQGDDDVSVYSMDLSVFDDQQQLRQLIVARPAVFEAPNVGAFPASSGDASPDLYEFVELGTARELTTSDLRRILNGPLATVGLRFRYRLPDADADVTQTLFSGDNGAGFVKYFANRSSSVRSQINEAVSEPLRRNPLAADVAAHAKNLARAMVSAWIENGVSVRVAPNTQTLRDVLLLTAPVADEDGVETALLGEIAIRFVGNGFDISSVDAQTGERSSTWLGTDFRAIDDAIEFALAARSIELRRVRFSMNVAFGYRSEAFDISESGQVSSPLTLAEDNSRSVNEVLLSTVLARTRKLKSATAEDVVDVANALFFVPIQQTVKVKSDASATESSFLVSFTDSYFGARAYRAQKLLPNLPVRTVLVRNAAADVVRQFSLAGANPSLRFGQSGLITLDSLSGRMRAGKAPRAPIQRPPAPRSKSPPAPRGKSLPGIHERTEREREAIREAEERKSRQEDDLPEQSEQETDDTDDDEPGSQSERRERAVGDISPAELVRLFEQDRERAEERNDPGEPVIVFANGSDAITDSGRFLPLLSPHSSTVEARASAAAKLLRVLVAQSQVSPDNLERVMRLFLGPNPESGVWFAFWSNAFDRVDRQMRTREDIDAMFREWLRDWEGLPLLTTGEFLFYQGEQSLGSVSLRISDFRDTGNQRIDSVGELERVERGLGSHEAGEGRMRSRDAELIYIGQRDLDERRLGGGHVVPELHVDYPANWPNAQPQRFVYDGYVFRTIAQALAALPVWDDVDAVGRIVNGDAPGATERDRLNQMRQLALKNATTRNAVTEARKRDMLLAFLYAKLLTSPEFASDIVDVFERFADEAEDGDLAEFMRDLPYTYHEVVAIEANDAASNLSTVSIDRTVTPINDFDDYDPQRDGVSPFAQAIAWLYRLAGNGQLGLTDFEAIRTVPSPVAFARAAEQLEEERLSVNASDTVYQLRVCVFPRNDDETVPVYHSMAVAHKSGSGDVSLRFPAPRDWIDCVFPKLVDDGDEPRLQMIGDSLPQRVPAFLGTKAHSGIPDMVFELWQASGLRDAPLDVVPPKPTHLYRSSSFNPVGYKNGSYTTQTDTVKATFVFRVSSDRDSLTLSDFSVSFASGDESSASSGLPELDPQSFGGSVQSLRQITREDDAEVVQDNDVVVSGIADGQALLYSPFSGGTQGFVIAPSTPIDEAKTAAAVSEWQDNWVDEVAAGFGGGGSDWSEDEDGNPSYYYAENAGSRDDEDGDSDDDVDDKRPRRSDTPPPAIVAQLERAEFAAHGAEQLAQAVEQSEDDDTVEMMAEDVIERLASGERRQREDTRDRIAALLASVVTNPLQNRPSEGKHSQNRSVTIAVQRSTERLRADAYSRATRQLAVAESRLRQALAARPSAARSAVSVVLDEIREQLRVIALAMEANQQTSIDEPVRVPPGAIRSALFGSAVPTVAEDPYLVFDYAWPFLARGNTPLAQTPMPSQLAEHLRITAYFYSSLFENGVMIGPENERIPLPDKADFVVDGRHFANAYDYYAYRLIEKYLLEMRRVFADRLLPKPSPPVARADAPPIDSPTIYEEVLGELEQVYASYAFREAIDNLPQRGLYNVFAWFDETRKNAVAAMRRLATEEQAKLFERRISAASVSEAEAERFLHDGKRAQFTQNEALFEAAAAAVQVMRERPETAAVAFHYLPAPTGTELNKGARKRTREGEQAADRVPAILANRSQQRALSNLANVTDLPRRYAGENAREEQQLPGGQLTRLFVRKGGAFDSVTHRALVDRYAVLAEVFDHTQDLADAAAGVNPSEMAFTDAAIATTFLIVKGEAIENASLRKFFAERVSAVDLIEVSVVRQAQSEPVPSGFALVVHVRASPQEDLDNDIAVAVAHQVGGGKNVDLERELVEASAVHLLRCVEHASASFELREQPLAQFYEAVVDNNHQGLATLPPANSTVAFARTAPLHPAMLVAAGRRYVVTDSDLVLISSAAHQSAAAFFDTATSFAYRSRLGRPTARLASETLVTHTQWDVTHFRPYGRALFVLREAPLPYLLESDVPASVEDPNAVVVAYRIVLLKDGEPAAASVPLAQSDWYQLDRGFVNGRVSFLPITVSVEDDKIVVDHDVAKVYDWHIESSQLDAAPYSETPTGGAQTTLGNRLRTDNERFMLEAHQPFVSIDRQVVLDREFLAGNDEEQLVFGVLVLAHTAQGARERPNDFQVVLESQVRFAQLLTEAATAETGALNQFGFRPGSGVLQPTLYGQREARIGDNMLHRFMPFTDRVNDRLGIGGVEIEYFAREANRNGRVTIGAVHLLSMDEYQEARQRRLAAADAEQRAFDDRKRRAPPPSSPRAQQPPQPQQPQASPEQPRSPAAPPRKVPRAKSPKRAAPKQAALIDEAPVGIYSKALRERTAKPTANSVDVLVTRVEFWMRYGFVSAVDRVLKEFSSARNMDWTLLYAVTPMGGDMVPENEEDPVRVRGSLRLVGSMRSKSGSDNAADIADAMLPTTTGDPAFKSSLIIIDNDAPAVIDGNRVPLSSMLARVYAADEDIDAASYSRLNVDRGKLAAAFRAMLERLPEAVDGENDDAYVATFGFGYLSNGNVDSRPAIVAQTGKPDRSREVPLAAPSKLSVPDDMLSGELFMKRMGEQEADELYIQNEPFAAAAEELRKIWARVRREQLEAQKEGKQEQPTAEAETKEVRVLHPPYSGPANTETATITRTEVSRDLLLAGPVLPSTPLAEYDLADFSFGPALAIDNKAQSGVTRATRDRVRALLGDRFATLLPEPGWVAIGIDFRGNRLRVSPTTMARLNEVAEQTKDTYAETLVATAQGITATAEERKVARSTKRNVVLQHRVSRGDHVTVRHVFPGQLIEEPRNN